MKIEINLLKEHPMNREIYGEDDEEQFNELFEKIKATGWIKPLVINRNYVIISGHRRYKVAKVLGRTEIDVEFYNESEEGQELEMLLQENYYRNKSTLQLVKEGEIYRKIEEKKAEARQLFGTNLSANLQQGRTNEIVGEKIGMSARSYHDARKVVQRIDEEEDSPVKFFLEDTLNSSVSAASKLVDKSDEFLQTVMDRSNGNPKNVTSAIRDLEQEEKSLKIHLPSGKYPVIYTNLSGKYLPDIDQLPISSIIEDDCVLFMWTTPTKLDESMNIGKAWGFSYKTAMVNNLDFLDEISDNATLLLIFTKGQPELIVNTTASIIKCEESSNIREKINKTYDGTKVELLFDGTFQGWNYWGNEV